VAQTQDILVVVEVRVSLEVWGVVVLVEEDHFLLVHHQQVPA
jgi:hypothetical protein